MTAQPPHYDLDHLLEEHFTTALEPQRGRAAEAFRRHLEAAHDNAHASLQAPSPIPFPRNAVPKRALWWWAGVPSLIAASLALVLTLQFIHTNMGGGDRGIVTPGKLEGNPGERRQIVFDTPQLEQVDLSRDINGGVAMSDDGPVRIIRQQRMKHAQWVDPTDHATYSITEEPVEKVGYVKIQPY